MIWRRIFLLIAVVFFCAALRSTSPISPKEIIDKMLDSIKHVKTLRYDLKSTERKEGKQKTSLSHIKINSAPLKIYFKSYERGIEVLWPSAEKYGSALINPNAFPYININLNPYSNTMRNGQHHTIFELGYTFYGEIVNHIVKQFGDSFDKYVKLGADVKWNSHDCFLIQMDYTDFKWTSYTVKKNENLVKIARARFLSEFMILEENAKSIKNYYDVKEGQIISIPNAYAKKMDIYIDKKTFLPLNIKVSDSKGVFEHYEYFNLHFNKPFAADEFSKDYKDYGF